MLRRGKPPGNLNSTHYSLRLSTCSGPQNWSSGSPFEIDFLEETSRTLDLLFPSWDTATRKVLRNRAKDFDLVDSKPRILDLKFYPYWKDRLLEVYEGVFQADPEGIGQLWKDRRDPQKFWTFWVAMAILMLTVVSTGASIIQTYVAIKAMELTVSSLHRPSS